MFSIVLPVIVVSIGCTVGYAAPRLTAHAKRFQGPAAQTLLTALAVAVLVQGAIFGIEEAFLEEVDVEMTVSAIATVATLVLALFVSARSGLGKTA